jgi:mannosyltransferase OCH1-like enzyme
LETRTIEESNPYSVFVYAVRSPLTREYYLRRLRKFFDFMDIEQERTIEERCNIFAQRGKEDSSWAFNSIIKFLQFQKERVEGGEITIRCENCVISEQCHFIQWRYWYTHH